jgi:hypothetical protein
MSSNKQEAAERNLKLGRGEMIHIYMYLVSRLQFLGEAGQPESGEFSISWDMDSLAAPFARAAAKRGSFSRGSCGGEVG